MTQKMRSMLFAPGNKYELLQNFSKIQPDIAIIDLEDAVPDSENRSARESPKVCSRTKQKRYNNLCSSKRSNFTTLLRIHPIYTTPNNWHRDTKSKRRYRY